MAKAARKISGKTKTVEDHSRREIRWVSIDVLDLDPQNPRLPDGMETARQGVLLETLAKEYDLIEIGQSIAENGYFIEEPLVVVAGPSKGRFTVVEGNRRLAALKLLENPDQAPKAYRKRWHAVSSERNHHVMEAPILEYVNRNDITPYLGFRHITGVLPWKPYQKAKYIAQLVEQAKLGFGEIARLIGSRLPTVREHYVAFSILRQARDAFAIDTANVEESFGVLRRALSDPGVRGFMGLKLDASEAALAKPIPKDRAESLREVISWMFGVGDEEAVLKDSRDIHKLGVVLASAKGVEQLRASRELDYAFELSGGEEIRLLEMLQKASYHLDQALPMTLRHRNNPEVQRAIERCRETFDQIDRLSKGKR